MTVRISGSWTMYEKIVCASVGGWGRSMKAMNRDTAVTLSTSATTAMPKTDSNAAEEGRTTRWEATMFRARAYGSFRLKTSRCALPHRAGQSERPGAPR